MNKKEIKKVYKYCELSKMVEELEKDIKQIIKRHSDIDIEFAYISNIVELEKQFDEKIKIYYLYDGNDKAYQQDNYFIWQHTQYEDSFYGCIYYPLEDNKYLKIAYSC